MTQSKRPRPCVQPPLANTIPPTAAVRPLLYLNGAPVLASGSRCGRTVSQCWTFCRRARPPALKLYSSATQLATSTSSDSNWPKPPLTGGCPDTPQCRGNLLSTRGRRLRSLHPAHQEQPQQDAADDTTDQALGEGLHCRAALRQAPPHIRVYSNRRLQRRPSGAGKRALTKSHMAAESRIHRSGCPHWLR